MRVRLSLAAVEQVLALPTAIRTRVVLAGEYRVRTGDYRVQFRIEGDQVIVVNVGHRDGFYDD